MVPPVAGCVWIIAKQTRLSVSAGAPDHCSGGERSYPSQENRRGMVALSATALATSFMALSIRRRRYELGPCSFRRKSLDLARPAV